MFDPEAAKEEREIRYQADRAAYGVPDAIDHEARAAAINACPLCDSDGYIRLQVCDHVDHTEAAKRGMAMIRQVMGWKA